jgi:hypothetical protein
MVLSADLTDRADLTDPAELLAHKRPPRWLTQKNADRTDPTDTCVKPSAIQPTDFTEFTEFTEPRKIKQLRTTRGIYHAPEPAFG